MNSKATLKICTVSLIAIMLAGCRDHPRVTSRESLDLIKQVYTACNTRNTERLSKCKQAISELSENGQLSEAEKSSFQSIVDLAEAGDWQTAQAESLQFARDQVR